LLIVGVDIGTSSTKGVLVDEAGRLVASHSVPHGVDRPHQGWAEQDADSVWWGDFVSVVRALLSQVPGRPDVIGVGVSGMCPTLVPVGHSGTPLRKGILYSIDRRALAEIDEIIGTLGESYVMDRSGNALSTQCIVPKMLWLKRNEPEVYRDTRWILGTSGYVVWKLTGEACWDHFCAGDGGLGYDMNCLEWDVDALTRVGVDPTMLPPLRWATEVVGKVCFDAARETGLPEGTPVVAGTGDAAAEMVGTGVIEEGATALLYGSTLSTMTPVRTPWVHPGFILTPGVKPSTYIVSSVLGIGAALLEWLRNAVSLRGVGLPDYEALEAEASSVPAGSDGLTFVPYLTGQRSPVVNPSITGALLGLTPEHRIGHIYRSALEGVALALRSCLSELERSGLLGDYELRAAGGGTRSQLWTQIVTDVCRHDQLLTATSVRAPIGAAYLAGAAAGLVSESALQHLWVTLDTLVQVRPGIADAYDASYRRFASYVKLLGDQTLSAES
jgi:xylulokinase